MTNFERHMEDIMEYGFSQFGYDEEEDIVCDCCAMECEDCRFYDKTCNLCDRNEVVEWLDEDEDSSDITISCDSVEDLASVLGALGLLK